MDNETLTVRQLLELYGRDSKAAGKHCPRSIWSYEHVFALFVEANVGDRKMGDVPIRDCRPYHLTDFISGNAGWKSTSTRRRSASSIKAAFQWAVDQGRIEKNPFQKVRYEQGETREAMSDADYET